MTVTIPAQATDIDAAWVNASTGDEIGEVTDVRCEHIGEGVGVLGEVARLHLTYADGASGPATVIAKCQSLHGDNIFLAQAMGFYEREVNFYNDLAGDVDVRVPTPHVAAVAPEGAPFVLVIEEITGAHMVDQIVGADRSQAEALIGTLARLHAPFWDNDRLRSLTWLPPMNNDLYKGAGALAEANWPEFVEKWGSQLSSTMMAVCEELTPRYPAMTDYVAGLSPQTIAHTDPRADNVLIGGSAGDGTIVLLDYQLMTRHLGAWDVAYFISQSLTAENRRAWQQDLLDLYRAELAGLGVTNYGADELMTHFRWCLMHQAWSQIAVANLDPGNERGRALLTAMLTRSWESAEENNAMELLEQF